MNFLVGVYFCLFVPLLSSSSSSSNAEDAMQVLAVTTICGDSSCSENLPKRMLLVLSFVQVGFIAVVPVVVDDILAMFPAKE